jgi:hypothetical protein
MKLRIEYFDQNEDFALFLPREGLVVSKPKCTDSALTWYLLRLDAPLHYGGAEHSHFLVASRWQGQPIKEGEPTSVFILLVPSTNATVADGFSYKHFVHVAWGMAHVVAAQP